MKIAIVGTGYVGLVTGVSFANMGNDVTCVDIDKKKVMLLRQGKMPIYEPGLEEMALKNIGCNRLHFTTDLSECIDDVDVVFCAVGTPPDEDGSADLKYVLAVARQFGQLINKYTVFVTKSTVPVGTGAKVAVAISEELVKRGIVDDAGMYSVVSNPEFLKEGSALKDVQYPERIVIGANNKKAIAIMEELYRPFNLNENKMIVTDIPSAEMIKYAANSMLATRISFMNDIANLCELVGANVDSVRKGIGSDSRIGKKFLYPGCGYGGSCFPKDVKALIKTAQKKGYEMKVLNAVEAVNAEQKKVLFNKLSKLGAVEGKTIALWGLAFKPETDDMREATALVLIEMLTKAGAKVKVFDPIAMDECYRRLGDCVEYCDDMYKTVEGCDALLLVTEWNEFRMPDWKKVYELMKGHIVIDGRNLYNREDVENNGFIYSGIGK